MKKKIISFLFVLFLLNSSSLSAQGGFFGKISKGIEKVSKELDKALDVESTTKTSTTSTSGATSISVPHENLKLTLIDTELKDDKFIVEFTLTNKGEDINSYYFCGNQNSNHLPKVFDNLGNECTLNMSFGDNTGYFSMGVSNALYTDVPVKFTLTITEFGAKATSISQVRIYANQSGSKKASFAADGNFIIKNIPLATTKQEETTASSATASSGLNITKTKGIMSMSDSYNQYDNRTKMTSTKQTSLKSAIKKLSNSDEFWFDGQLSDGKTIYDGEYGKLATILSVVKDHGSKEYLLSFDKTGKLLDCITIAGISVYGGDRGEGTMEGNKATACFSAEGSDYYILYEITPELKFKKLKEWEK